MTTITATYSPDDNKLRLSASTRIDTATYARVKAAGFAWAPKQEQFIAPMWTPERADLCIELAGEIEDDDGNISERAQDRAERFEGYEDNRRADADAAHAEVHRITDGIPLGQPILVGHHSERRARKDAERIENGMRRAVRMWDTAEYWKRRAAAAIAHAAYKERPDVRHRRIKGLEADQRKHQKSHDGAQTFLRLWDTAVSGGAGWKSRRSDGTPTDARSRTLQLAGMSGSGACDFGLWSKLDKGEITPEQARDEAMAQCNRSIAYHARWLAHIGFRLDYERAMLGEAGGIKAEGFDLQPGGTIAHRGRRSVIKRINKVAGKTVSVTVVGQSWTVGIEEITAYEPPTAESAQAVQTLTKLAPLVNYETPNCARMTQADWAKIHSDHKSTKTIAATETHAAHRLRYVMGFLGVRFGAPRGESWGSTLVFLTDAKVTTAPEIKARKSMARKIAEAEGQDTAGMEDAPAPTREQERAAAREVIAEATAPTFTPPTTQPDTPTAQSAAVQRVVKERIARAESDHTSDPGRSLAFWIRSQAIDCKNCSDAEHNAASPILYRMADEADSEAMQAMREALRTGVQIAVAPQLFPTPPELAARMVELANIEPGAFVLEPSAGTGRILDAINALHPDMAGLYVSAVEVNRALAEKLAYTHPKVGTRCTDFLSIQPRVGESDGRAIYDAIVMNPPFERGADVEHVTHALRFLAPGGRLVAVMSAGVTFRQDKATALLRQIITDGGGTIELLPDDTFSSAGTSVRTVLVTYTRDDESAWERVTGNKTADVEL